jgi:ketosteroid isomerase-like protein
MNWLAENALAIWAVGAVALTMALVVYFQLGTRNSQLAVVAVVLVTAALLVVEAMIETPREAVARTVDEIAAAVRANDMPGVLSYIAPTATTLRQEIETAMPLATIERAAVLGTPQIELAPGEPPTEAFVVCRVFVQGTLKQGGMRGGQAAACTVTFARDGERWLVTDYTSDRDWRRAVGR